MKCIGALEAWLKETFQQQDLTVNYEYCPPEIEGDVTVNCFRFAKALRQNPMELAGKVAEFFRGHDDVARTSVVKAFVNISLEERALFRDTVADPQALLDRVHLPAEQRRRVVVEYSAPNTNKPLHLGHIRNNVLGASVVSLLRRVGHEAIPVNLVNDRGIHICKSMIAYQRWGQDTDPDRAGVKGDHLVGSFYVRYNDELQLQLAALRQADPTLAKENDDALFGRTEIGAATREMLQAWEAGDDVVRALWSRMNAWVLAGFDVTYRRMGVAFDKVYRESDTYREGKQIVDSGLARSLFLRRSDGAVEVDLEEQKLGRKVLLRADGTSVYITQDLGTTLLKQGDFEPHEQVWIVGDEQIHHFKVLFAVLKKLGHAWADELTHMAYGMVDLPTGKMKSREGTVVDADDLLDEMEELARAACSDREPELRSKPDDLEARAQAIGQGALKYWLLKFKPNSRILFDPQASIQFEGDTGPYVQYACARIHSILAKAAAAASEEPHGAGAAHQPIDWSALDHDAERNLALCCAAYPGVVRKAAAALDPSILVGYLLGLAKDFSRFYTQCPVLKAPGANLRAGRLALCDGVRRLLVDGLDTLTIDTLECM